MASTTARSLLERAFRRVGILAEEESMSASQGSYGLTMLNDMLHGFESEGIHYAHTDLASLDTTLNVPDGQIRNAMLMTVRELASEYGSELSAEDRDQIHKAKMALQAFYYVPIKSAPEMALRPRQFGRFSFDRG